MGSAGAGVAVAGRGGGRGWCSGRRGRARAAAVAGTRKKKVGEGRKKNVKEIRGERGCEYETSILDPMAEKFE